MKVKGYYRLRSLESLSLIRLSPKIVLEKLVQTIKLIKETVKETLEILQVRCQDMREPWLYWSP